MKIVTFKLYEQLSNRWKKLLYLRVLFYVAGDIYVLFFQRVFIVYKKVSDCKVLGFFCLLGLGWALWHTLFGQNAKFGHFANDSWNLCWQIDCKLFFTYITILSSWSLFYPVFFSIDYAIFLASEWCPKMPRFTRLGPHCLPIIWCLDKLLVLDVNQKQIQILLSTNTETALFADHWSNREACSS